MESLQSDLEKLYTWQDLNNMKFNGKKFEVLRYGTNEELKQSSNYLTPDAENMIEVKETLRDLGVQMTDDGKFSQHISQVCSKARQKCGWILRTFSSRQTTFLKFLFKTLVQGHVDYCSQLYFPGQSSELEAIEEIQKSFTRKIPEVNHLNYWERLSHLKMYSQQRRAERYRIIYTWKVLEGLVPNCGITECISDRRGRECIIPQVKGKARIQSLRNQSFQVNGPRLFNSLPKKLRDIRKVSVDDFKEQLDNYLADLPDHPKVGDLIPHVCNQITAKPSNSIVDVIKSLKHSYGGG